MAALDLPVRRRAGGLGSEGTEERALADGLYDELREPASTCSTTTATPARARSSPMPSCSGCPLRVTVGRRTLAGGEIEVQIRRGRESRTVPVRRAAAQAIAELWRELP